VRDLGLLAVGATHGDSGPPAGPHQCGDQAQETLKDLFAGISPHVAVPFREGDWIEVSGYRGQVTSLTLMNTLVASMDGAHQMLPNSKVAQEVLRRQGPADPIGNRFHSGLHYGLPPAQARPGTEGVGGFLRGERHLLRDVGVAGLLRRCRPLPAAQRTAGADLVCPPSGRPHGALPDVRGGYR
jgi:hypothetical protein